MFPFCLNKKNSIPFLLLWFCVFSPGVATVTGLYWEDAGARPRPASDGVRAAAAPVPAASGAPQLPRAPHEELQAQSVLREHPQKNNTHTQNSRTRLWDNSEQRLTCCSHGGTSVKNKTHTQNSRNLLWDNSEQRLTCCSHGGTSVKNKTHTQNSRNLLWDNQTTQSKKKLTETLANGYSSKSTQRELSNEYQHDRVWMFLHGGTSVQKIIHVYFITHARPDSMHFAWLFYMI